MSKDEEKKYLDYIKFRYPVGSYVYDDTRSQPYKVTKRSIFKVFERDDYAIRPDDDYIDIYFLVRDPGKYKEFFFIESKLKKYLK